MYSKSSERRLSCTARTGLVEGYLKARVVRCSEYLLSAADNGAFISQLN